MPAVEVAKFLQVVEDVEEIKTALLHLEQLLLAGFGGNNLLFFLVETGGVVVDNISHHLFKGDGVVTGEGALQVAREGEEVTQATLAGFVVQLPGAGPWAVSRKLTVVFQVPGFDVGDAAAAEVEELEHILRAEVGEVEGESRGGLQVAQAGQQTRQGGPEQGGTAGVGIVGITGIGELRIAFWQQTTVDYFLQGDIAVRRQGGADEAGKVDEARLAGADKFKELGAVTGGNFTAGLFAELVAVGVVEGVEDSEDIFFFPANDFIAVVQQLPYGLVLQEAEDDVFILKTAGFPCDAGVAVAERYGELYCYLDLHIEDSARSEQLFNHCRTEGVVIDDSELADSFQGGIKEELGRVFPPLGTGVVDVVIEGVLVPLLWHFEEVAADKFFADEAGFAGGCETEIVGEAQEGCGIGSA